MRVFCLARTIFVTILTASPALPVSATNVTWEPLGPAGGDQFDVVISPDDPNTIYTLAHFAIHRSTDAGQTWRSLQNADMASGTFLSMTIDPLDTQHLYAANSASGVWESLDQGDTWTNCSNGLPAVEGFTEINHSVASIIIDSNGDLLAGVKDSNAGSPPAYLYRSQGGCGNWQQADSGITFSAAQLTQSTTALMEKMADGSIWAMVYGGGVFAYDQGVWISRNGNLPEAGLNPTFLAPDPIDSARVLLGTERGWIYETTDGGASWAQMVLPEAMVDLPVLPLVYAISLDPNNSQLIYVDTNDAMDTLEQPLFHARNDQTGGGGGYISLDGGATWNAHNLNAFRVTVDPSETITLAAGTPNETTLSRNWYVTSGGAASLQKSEDGAQSFSIKTNGLNNMLVNRIWRHPASPTGQRLLFAGAESGLYLIRDSDPWEFQSSVEDTVYTWSFDTDPVDGITVYYSTGHPAWSHPEQQGIYRTTMDCFGPECPAGEQILSGVGVWRVMTTATQPDTIYAATQDDGIMVSRDRGLTWASMNDGLTLPQSITDIVLDAAGEPLYASSRASNGEILEDPPQSWHPTTSEGGAVFFYDSQLAQWLDISESPYATLATLDLEIDPQDPNVLYAATVRGVYRTADQGLNWETVLSDKMVHDLMFDVTKPGYIYAATYNGVMRSSDNGAQWHTMSNGLRMQTIYSLEQDPATGILFAGTGGNSVYQLLPDPNPQSVITLAEPTIDAGIVPLSFTGTARLNVTNDGEADLVITGINSSNGAFSLSGSFPMTVTPGSSLDIDVVYAPSFIGYQRSVLQINSNDPVNAVTWALVTGQGRAALPPSPEVTVNGSGIPVEVEYGSTIQIGVKLADIGDYDGFDTELWLKITLSDASTHWYVQDTGWVESATPQVLANATLNGSMQSYVLEPNNLPSGASNVQFMVDHFVNGTLDGEWMDATSFTVLPAPPAMWLSTELLDFGSVPVGFNGKQTVYLVNTGEQDLVVDNLSTSSALYTIVEAPVLPVNIPSEDLVAVIVQYAPDAVGSNAATLMVSSNDPLQATTSVELTGSGVAAIIPVPLLKANGQAADLTIAASTSLNLTVEVDAGDYSGQQAEWWLKADTPLGVYWMTASGGWVKSETALMGVLGPVKNMAPLAVMNMTLPQGAYQFTLVLDDQINGNYDVVWTDTISVTVQ